MISNNFTAGSPNTKRKSFKEYGELEMFSLYMPVQGIPCPLIFYPINLITENMTKKLILHPWLAPYKSNLLVFGSAMAVDVIALMFWSQNFLFYMILNALASAKMDTDLQKVDQALR